MPHLEGSSSARLATRSSDHQHRRTTKHRAGHRHHRRRRPKQPPRRRCRSTPQRRDGRRRSSSMGMQHGRVTLRRPHPARLARLHPPSRRHTGSDCFGGTTTVHPLTSLPPSPCPPRRPPWGRLSHRSAPARCSRRWFDWWSRSRGRRAVRACPRKRYARERRRRQPRRRRCCASVPPDRSPAGGRWSAAPPFMYARSYRHLAFGHLPASARAGGAFITVPPAPSIPTLTEPEQPTPDKFSYHTTDTLTREGAPRTAAHATLATLAAMAEGAPPRLVRQVRPERAATRRRQRPVLPPHRRRLHRTTSLSPSPGNRSSIPGVTDSSTPFSPHPERTLPGRSARFSRSLSAFTCRR